VDQFSWNIPFETVKLRVEVKNGGQCLFSYAVNDEFVHAPEIFKARQGEWIGAKVDFTVSQLTARTMAQTFRHL
jgi:hypothetical protein